ncbi:MAG: gamma carbonic anhydrase family protein [Myxococcales bacterium]|jgi:carbonic anhydrase/acetyltransferase-like protein (isoleucine patch superfamily)|nr:gamma carbonic anhydrase family protein [Myxococcales bacterium]
MTLRSYFGKFPNVSPDAFIDESAQLIGDVTVGARSSVWCNAVVRGDVNFIRIGEETNVQDLACLHVTHDTHPLVLGDRVSVAHGVCLHGCTIGDGTLIGIGAIVLDGAIVGEGCLVAAGSLVTPKMEIPPHSFVMGAPARVHRSLADAEVSNLLENAANYVRYREAYLEVERPFAHAETATSRG